MHFFDFWGVSKNFMVVFLVTAGLDRHVLFLDNLTAHQTDEVKEDVAKGGGVAWFGLANATSEWQVVDAGNPFLSHMQTNKINFSCIQFFPLDY